MSNHRTAWMRRACLLLSSLTMAVTVTTCSQDEIQAQVRDGVTLAMNEIAVAITTDAAYNVLGYYDD